MAIKDYHVVVCIPSLGTWTAETGKSVAMLFSYFALHRVKGARSQKMSLITIQSSMLSWSRELSVKKALQSGATHILFIDSDMKFPMNMANKMLEEKKDFLAANCTTRAFPVETVAHTMDGERLDSRGSHGLVKVQHVGLAISMISRVALQKLRQPLFLMDWLPPLSCYCGEDVYFCQKLAAEGIDLWIDHDLSKAIQHIGTYAYGHGDLTDASFEEASQEKVGVV